MKYRLSRQQDSTIDTRIVDELAAAQESLECGTTLPWFLNVQASFEVVGAHDSLALSNYPGFLRIAEDDFAFRVEDLTRSDETIIKLTRQDTFEQLLRYSAGVADEATLPEAYCVLGTTAHIRKKQVVSRTYWLSYYRQDPTAIAVGGSTLWTINVPDLIMAEAGIHVARYLRDSEALQIFNGLRGAKYAEMVRRNQALQDADQNYVMDE
jgi:hypothetical protein